MKTPPANILAARAANASTLCKVWRVERTDGTVYTFTEHDQDLVVDGETYLAESAISATTVQTTGELNVDDLEIQGALSSVYITEEDLLLGRWDGAAIRIAEVEWTQPELGYDVQRWGWLGRVRVQGGKFIAEMMGPTAKLQRTIGHLYQANCRATLGDTECGVDTGALAQAGEVTAVTSGRVFDAGGAGSPLGVVAPPSGDELYWQYGLLTWSTGNNAGLSMEVHLYDGVTVELVLPMPSPVQVGDTFSIVPGCDHTRATCRDRFSNVLNFRGEPDAPISDDVVKGPV